MTTDKLIINNYIFFKWPRLVDGMHTREAGCPIFTTQCGRDETALKIVFS
jgi:hypothetical protein